MYVKLVYNTYVQHPEAQAPSTNQRFEERRTYVALWENKREEGRVVTAIMVIRVTFVIIRIGMIITFPIV